MINANRPRYPFKELKFLALGAEKYNSPTEFAGTLGIFEKDIVWSKVFGSSVEGKRNPNDISGNVLDFISQ